MIVVYHREEREVGIAFYLFKNGNKFHYDYKVFDYSVGMKNYLRSSKLSLIQYNFEFYYTCCKKIINEDSTHLEKDCLDKCRRFLIYINKSNTKYNDLISSGILMESFMKNILANIDHKYFKRMSMMTFMMINFFNEEKQEYEQSNI